MPEMGSIEYGCRKVSIIDTFLAPFLTPTLGATAVFDQNGVSWCLERCRNGTATVPEGTAALYKGLRLNPEKPGETRFHRVFQL